MFVIKHITRSLAFVALILTLNACVVTGHPDTHIRGSLHGWYYYPDAQVYFHITSGNYYYRDGTKWVRTRTLPTRHHLDRHDRVPLWIDSDKPHVKHREHRERYTPRPQYKRNKSRDPEERRHNQRMHERFEKRRD